MGNSRPALSFPRWFAVSCLFEELGSGLQDKVEKWAGSGLRLWKGLGTSHGTALYSLHRDAQCLSASVHQPDLALANCSGFACEPWSPSLLVKPASLLSLHHRSLFRPEASPLVPLPGMLSTHQTLAKPYSSFLSSVNIY